MIDDQKTPSSDSNEFKSSAETRENYRPDNISRRRLPQISLLTFLLGIALFAVWLAWWQAGQTMATLERQMPGLRSVARELKIDDTSQFAVVKKNNQWLGEIACEIYIPSDQPFQLCLAMDAVGDDNFPDPVDAVTLPSGEHRISIRYDTEDDESIVRISIDERTAIEESRPRDWEPRRGSSGGMLFSLSSQHSTDEPLVLYRRRFLTKALVEPTSSNAGILVWVEPVNTD